MTSAQIAYSLEIDLQLLERYKQREIDKANNLVSEQEERISLIQTKYEVIREALVSLNTLSVRPNTCLLTIIENFESIV